MASTKETAPGWRMGSADRFRYDHVRVAAEVPGAGQYRNASAVGRQALSTKKTLPTCRFGTSTRDKANKIFISAEHEKDSFGELSPGPTTAMGHPAIGKQTVSRKKSNPSWGFGTARRQTVQVTDTPGPGTYWA
ncbi:unnamed protein product [Pedinophyceae sp. YPF-701]|nr:unnamed protein product [Pedinophyceae sp. YPF-701]